MPFLEQPIRFGEFILFEEVGQGGMAQIFRGRRSQDSADVVVKRMLPNMAEDEENVWMFLDEARLHSRVKHPNIVQVYEYGERDGQYFIAMEYVAGRDLARLINRARRFRKPIPEEVSLYVMIEALKGLGHIHAAVDESGEHLNMVHRDINPANIFLSWDGKVKLGDFGIAKASTLPTITSDGSFRGTLGYMSPEQIRAEPLNGQSDLYSIGSVLYELYCGQTPFQAESDMEVLKRTLEAKITPPSKIVEDIHPRMEKIILQALQKKTNKRYATAEEFNEDILEYLFSQGKAAISAQGLTRILQNLFVSEIGEEKRFLDAVESGKISLEAARPQGPSYYLLGPNQEPLGPFDLIALKAMAQAQRLTEKDHLAAAGEKFRPLHELPDLWAQISPDDYSRYLWPGSPEKRLTGKPLVAALDTDAKALDSIASALTGAGFQVLVFRDAETAVKAAAKTTPKLIISGIILDGMDGYQVISRLQSIPQTSAIPVMLLTARANMQDRIKGFRYGVVDYILKPVQPEDVAAKARGLLESLPFREGAFRGDFSNTAYDKVADTLSEQGKTGILLIQTSSTQGRVTFFQGLPQMAFLGDRKDAGALEQIRQLREGAFQFNELGGPSTMFMRQDIRPEDQFLNETSEPPSQEGDSHDVQPGAPRLAALEEIKPATRSILLVDDNPEESESIAVGLQELGFPVIRAADGEEGLAAVIKHRPALILSDIRMPKMDGWEFCWLLRQDRRVSETPFILMMVRPHHRDLLRKHDTGASADDYIGKASSLDSIVRRIQLSLTPLVSLETQLGFGSQAEVSGRLEFSGLLHVIRFVLAQRMSGILKVGTILGKGSLHFVEGELRGALVEEGGNAAGDEALVQLLTWEGGEFTWSPLHGLWVENLEGPALSLLEGACSEVNAINSSLLQDSILNAGLLEYNEEKLHLYEQIAPEGVKAIIRMVRDRKAPQQIVEQAPMRRAEAENVLGVLIRKKMISIVSKGDPGLHG
ncbi:MAG: Serine/threonine-protein kinase PknD [Myxococcota bacterium]|nr:Serine/threonine-protein kinase PknD [Myxococcota bacterium]